jgi:hypothetical protein
MIAVTWESLGKSFPNGRKLAYGMNQLIDRAIEHDERWAILRVFLDQFSE